MRPGYQVPCGHKAQCSRVFALGREGGGLGVARGGATLPHHQSMDALDHADAPLPAHIHPDPLTSVREHVRALYHNK
jgi:hypothetical protein